MADVVYNGFKKHIMDGSLDLVNDTIKCALMANTYTPDIDADEFWSDVSADEASGTNYTAGGNALTTKTTTIDDTNDRGLYDADNPVFSNVTITARYAVIYKDTGVAGTSVLIGCLDFGSDQTATAGDFTVNLNAAGLLALN